MSREHIRAGVGWKQKGHFPLGREWPGSCGLGLGGGGFGGGGAVWFTVEVQNWNAQLISLRSYGIVMN